MFRTVLFISALALFATAARFEDVPEEIRALRGEELVNHINKQEGSWKAEINPRFEGLNKDELKHFLGAQLKGKQIRHRGTPSKMAKLDAAPKSFDAVQNWPECKDVIGLIQDQSACGSCWAVSTASAMGDRLCIASKAKIQTSISSLDLMACCSSCGYQCQGGYPDEAWYYFTSNGISTGSNYTEDALCKPYPIAPCVQDPKTKKHTCPEEPTNKFKCEKKCQKSYTAEEYKNDKYFGKDATYFSRDNEGAIADLVKNGPIVAAFKVYEDFYLYKNGIYEYKGGDFVGGHAVRIVGYGTENGVDYWKVANSWDWYWGEQGYFRIRRGTNECGFEDEITSALADVDRSLKNK